MPKIANFFAEIDRKPTFLNLVWAQSENQVIIHSLQKNRNFYRERNYNVLKKSRKMQFFGRNLQKDHFLGGGFEFHYRTQSQLSCCRNFWKYKWTCRKITYGEKQKRTHTTRRLQPDSNAKWTLKQINKEKGRW